MRFKHCVLLPLAALMTGSAQAGAGLWQSAVPTTEPSVAPRHYAVFQPQRASLEALLESAPASPAQGTVIPLPLPDGGTRLFRVWKTPIGDAELSRRYPELQTYTGTALDNAQVTAKLDLTPAGFHGMILDGQSAVYIDPYGAAVPNTYLVYDRRELGGRLEPMRCDAGEAAVPMPVEGTAGGALKVNGAVHRTYRLALACTGEYAVAVAGASPTKAQVLAKMVTSVNRVNGIYERELAVTLQLIGNTDTLIFLDGTTDPYTNNSGSDMLGQNQTTVTARIGSVNYDIGHVFSTGGGGVAVAGVCNSGNKARGVTGGFNPVGDPFDVDYVAHEMGHQFDADHTFNAATGSCGSGNGVNSSAYEPGSGSTIMAYAGICGGADNLQTNSDAYFHVRSLDQIATYITNGTASTCPVTVPTVNIPPAVPSYGAVYAIPWRTPFELTAPAATDVTTDGPLTYAWEEWDRGQFGASFNTARFAGPIFRSFFPDTSRTRVFPTRRRLVRNSYRYLGEKLPDTTRTLRFTLTVRDVFNGLGAYNWVNTDTIRLQVIQATSDSNDVFRVTSFNTAGSALTGASTQTVTWNVAGTDAAPINCGAVDIYFSTDSGYTWPYLLLAGTPNDGSEAITLPNVTTTAGRLKVKASNNVFFEINDALLEVNSNPTAVNAIPAQGAVAAVFPVPAHDLLTVELAPGQGVLDARITDLAGRAIWQGAVSGRHTVSVAGWPRGVYLLQLTNGSTGERTVCRVAVQ